MKQAMPAKSKWIWIDYVYFLLLLLGIYFAFLNIIPYERVIAALSSTAQDSLWTNVFSNIPIIKDIGNFIGKTIIWTMGASMWAVIQIIETLPIVIFADDLLLETIIRTGGKNKFEINDNDDPVMKTAKKIYNRLPLAVIRNLKYAQIFTYVFDFMLVITVYPPIQGGLADFLFAIATGNYAVINGLNLALSVITLFACEMIALLIIYSNKLVLLYKQSRGLI